MTKPRLVMHDIRKRFGSTQALAGVHLELDRATCTPWSAKTGLANRHS